MQLETDEIKRIVNDAYNYKLAKTYAETAENLECLTITCDYNNMYHVDAYIQQNSYHDHVEILIDEQYHIQMYACDCPYCTSISGCAHIGEILLLIQLMEPCIFPYHFSKHKFLKLKQQRKTIEDQESRRSHEDLMIQKFRGYEEYRNQLRQIHRKEDIEASSNWLHELIENTKYQLPRTHSQDVHLLCEIDIDKGYSQESHIILSLRIASRDKRFYIIKNINEFLWNIHANRYFTYGKELAFLHDFGCFDDASQKIILLLMRATELPCNQYIEIRRYILLEDEVLDDFYDLMKTLPKLYRDFTIIEEKGNVSLHIMKDQQDYQVQLLSPKKQILYGRNHLYKIRDTSLVRKQLNKVCIDLLRQLQEPLLISQEMLPDFQGYVLMECEPYLTIENKALLPELPQEDFIQLYVDMDDDGLISMKIECHYKGKTLYGFTDERNPRIIHLEKLERLIHEYAQTIDYDAHIAYMDTHDEQTLSFLQNGLTYASTLCDVYVSDAIRSFSKPQRVQIQVGVSVEHNLLQIDLQSVDITKEEVYEVLSAYRKKHKFHRLQDGRLITLEQDSIAEASAMLEEFNVDLNDLKKGELSFPAYRCFHMEDLLEQEQALTTERKDSYVDFLQQYAKQSSTLTISPRFETLLRDYQKTGVAWLLHLHQYHFGGILADDMGLGKTLQVIALLESMIRPEHCSLIITPSSLILNWEDEMQKFSSNLNVCCVYGNANTRKQAIAEAQNYDVLITSYDYLKRDIDDYMKMQYTYVVLDEAQYIKNQKTKNAACVKKLTCEYRLALSGTPIENSLAELWSIFDFLMPGYLYNYHYFQTHYEKDIVQNKNMEKQQKLKRMVEPFILRRIKKDVLKELPDKIEHTVPISFEEEERKLYLANLASVNSDLKKHLGMEKMDKIAVLAMLTKLRQLCCEPRILYDTIQDAGSKLSACMDLLHTLKENNQKVLLFSSFTAVLDFLSEELRKEHFSYFVLKGSTSKKERREMVKRFQNGLCDVFLISLKAGGTGLNLTAASAVIHYDPWWNVSAQNQATDRAYRIGQNQNVQVYKLIMKDSIEEQMQKLQVKKKVLSDAFVEENAGSITSMSMEDILSLFQQ